MNRQPHAVDREAIVAGAIREVVCEMRMVDLADYIAFIRMERFAMIADIVQSASELYLMPGTLALGNGGEARVEWGEPPSIALDLELKPAGACVYFTLHLHAAHAAVEVNYVSFDTPGDDPQANTAFLARSLDNARIRGPEAGLAAAE
jgi:hypothetical protein